MSDYEMSSIHCACWT